MNKEIEHPKTILSVSSILEVLTPPAKKNSCRKIANKQDHFKQKQSFKREKDHVQGFILAFFKLLIVEKLAVSLRCQQSD